MEFPPLNPRYNFISLEFATVKQNSLLLYNPGELSTSEFLALEIVNGRLRLSFDLGSGVTRLETAKPVADGSFHNVTVRRIGNVGHLYTHTHMHTKHVLHLYLLLSFGLINLKLMSQRLLCLSLNVKQ